MYARGRCGTASRKKRTEINNDPLILYSIMKKTFVAALAALALVSCSKEETVTYGTNGEPLDGAAVCLTFTDAPASRASLNSTAAAETWEKSLTSLTVYVFNSQGNLVAQRSFTSEELVDKSATFALPHSAAGTTCDFYAVANLSLTGSLSGVRSDNGCVRRISIIRRFSFGEGYSVVNNRRSAHHSARRTYLPISRPGNVHLNRCGYNNSGRPNIE